MTFEVTFDLWLVRLVVVRMVIFCWSEKESDLNSNEKCESALLYNEFK